MTEITVRPPGGLASGLVRLIRPGAVLAACTICLVGARLASPEGWPGVVLAMTAVGSAVASANVFNDVIDLEADRINVPGRPLPTGQVPVPIAEVWSAILGLVALLAAVPLGLAHVAIVAVVLAASVWYSLRLKRIMIIGPTVVALLLALALVFGTTIGTAVSGPVWVGAIEIAVFTFGRETLKGARDSEGDRLSGVATIANVWGARRAVAVFAACCAIVVAVSALPASLPHLAVMALLVGLPGIVFSVIWWTSDMELKASAIERTAWLWATGLVGIALL
jgi:geranylgeranylglycerol-phosphate geranylgeranyltransferase